MWDYRYLLRIDFRMIPIVIALLLMSLLIVSAFSVEFSFDVTEETFFTPVIKQQLRGFAFAFFVFILCAGFDYNKLREWTWPLYIGFILLLIGLFFTPSVQGVHRWYRLPMINISFQPSEYAKLVVVVALSWFLERRESRSTSWSTALYAGLITGIPFILILKEPDLGTALILFPMTLVMFYFGGIRPSVVKVMTWIGAIALICVAIIFLEIISYEQIRSYATLFLKDYQVERLNPHTHHQKAAAMAIALGGITGRGWRTSEFTGGGWLPTPYTDSVFPAFGEIYGFLGLLFLLLLFYTLIYLGFQVTAVASTSFGRLLSAGISTYLAIHVLINIGMMSGFLPITGVPLILLTYGGSSLVSTMTALGILQSIYSRRYIF